MKYLTVLSTVFKCRFFSRSFCLLRSTSSVSIFKPLSAIKEFRNNVSGESKFLHSDSDNEELFEDLHTTESGMEHAENARNILFQNYQDDIIDKLNSCVSVEEVLNMTKKYINIYEDKHVVQTILVLRDLQQIFYQYNGFKSGSLKLFLESIEKKQGFNCLLRFIREKLECFDSEYLSYVLFYLNKLGIPIENELMQSIALKVRDQLQTCFHLDHCSRFLKTVFTEVSVRPYYLSLPLIPTIASQIEKCESIRDLSLLTVCLNRLHNVVTNELLEKYTEKVTDFLKKKKLQATHYRTLLKIVLFLNYPEWRDKSVLLSSECMLLLKNEIHLLKVEELTNLYEVFFKNQEPGMILDNIQRCSAKFLHQLDEVESTNNTTRLKLFSSLIYFSSPTHRVQFQKHIMKYLKACHDYKSLIQLRKIFSYIKVADPKLCLSYWNLSLQMLDESINADIVLKLCQNYIYFNTDINNYRHYKYETAIMGYIKKFLLTDVFLNPAKISGYLSFAMLYGKDEDVLELLTEKFEQNISRIKASDCLKVSQILSLLNSCKNIFMPQEKVRKIKRLLNRRTKELIEINENNYLQNNVLLKAFILRHDFDNETMEQMLLKYKELEYMSSKIMENISYVFLITQSLIPEVVNKCTEYVINHSNNILGFNAEKILYLCFYLAYYPINGDKFFEVVTDVIIRDQERLSGLAFLQSALSLCYFNKLPSSFIKQIFNVEFLEKLDMELENCYSKDKYPQRVRQTLMLLNRAVCLEYPEYDVPWFHKKYIEDIHKKFVGTPENKFKTTVKEYLARVIGTEKNILEKVVTPYGYHVEFVLNLNDRDEAVPLDSTDIKRSVAILLLRQSAFTHFYTHLKGKYQFKIRHLEMLGYEVAIVYYNEWVNLLYGEERLEYVSKLIQRTDKKHTVDFFR